ncbi:MAG TPA: nitroreductase family deazaflavin-dependent oxidoreductase [Acidimicrobiales bacterium]|nr:nitroreductase family deazaflavin-dependent oxidoreductase [Acidimicrobiales bacterium]
MALDGEYEPSPAAWVRDQVEAYERTGGEEGGDMQGAPVVVLWTRGRHSGKVRKAALIRVEHEGKYAVVASLGGAPKHPVWYLNLLADPDVSLQDGPKIMDLRARTATPEEKAIWWPRATAAWPAYDNYQAKTERDIPVVLLEPR